MLLVDLRSLFANIALAIFAEVRFIPTFADYGTLAFGQ